MGDTPKRQNHKADVKPRKMRLKARGPRFKELSRRWRRKIVSDGLLSTHPGFAPHSILPYFAARDHSADIEVLDLDWYDHWVKAQIEEQPEHLFQPLWRNNSDPNSFSWEQVKRLWVATAQLLGRHEISSVDQIVQSLTEEEILEPAFSKDALPTARALVFAIVGWQTMLYKADFGSSPLNCLSISDELDGLQCHSRMALKQKDNICKRPIAEALLGFGVFLPARKSASSLSLDAKALKDFKIVHPSSSNVHVLKTIGRLIIKWVDSLSCHLELDTSANILYLFRFPSFCIANMDIDSSEPPSRSPLHACASQGSSGLPWASKEDVSQLLKETVLTYRLLFGQTKAARKFYRQLEPFDDMPGKRADPALSELCSRKHGKLSGWYTDREVYDLNDDFPIYRDRLAAIQKHLSVRKARTWRELWRDKRDSAQWFTFWAVVVIGGLGILLASMQVVLQAVQIGLSVGASSP